MDFPGYPNGCPPTDAVPAAGPVFRATGTDPPTDDDFLSYHEVGRSLGHPTQRALCMARGLSVFRDIADARHLIEMQPGVARFVAAGTLTPDRGVTLATPPKSGVRPTHTTWWCPAVAGRSAGFVIVEGTDDVDD